MWPIPRASAEGRLVSLPPVELLHGAFPTSVVMVWACSGLGPRDGEIILGFDGLKRKQESLYLSKLERSNRVGLKKTTTNKTGERNCVINGAVEEDPARTNQ